MDIYTPTTGRKSYPVIVMYHGGGWLINNETIMDQAAEYLSTHGDYIVCNVNYRLLPAQNNTVHMNQIIEDAYGAVLWVKHNIKQYQGDPKRIIVTGDSAGGHLATTVATMGSRTLSPDGFVNGPAGFRPSWMPAGKTIEQLKKEDALAIQAAIISYGAFDIYSSAKNGSFETDQNMFWAFAGAKARGLFGNEINVNHPLVSF